MCRMESTKCDTDLHIRIQSELLERLKKMAKKARRGLADYLRITLEDHASET